MGQKDVKAMKFGKERNVGKFNVWGKAATYNGMLTISEMKEKPCTLYWANKKVA